MVCDHFQLADLEVAFVALLARIRALLSGALILFLILFVLRHSLFVGPRASHGHLMSVVRGEIVGAQQLNRSAMPASTQEEFAIPRHETARHGVLARVICSAARICRRTLGGA